MVSTNRNEPELAQAKPFIYRFLYETGTKVCVAARAVTELHISMEKGGHPTAPKLKDVQQFHLHIETNAGSTAKARGKIMQLAQLRSGVPLAVSVTPAVQKGHV